MEEENRFVCTAEEWRGHEHIVHMVDDMFALPELVSAVRVNVECGLACV
jgi:hypothetical protein